MAGKEIKLEKDATSEIVVANTDSEFWGGRGKRRRRRTTKTTTEAAVAGLSKVETQAAPIGRSPIWGLPYGRNTNIHPSIDPAKGGP